MIKPVSLKGTITISIKKEIVYSLCRCGNIKSEMSKRCRECLGRKSRHGARISQSMRNNEDNREEYQQNKIRSNKRCADYGILISPTATRCKSCGISKSMQKQWDERKSRGFKFKPYQRKRGEHNGELSNELIQRV
ncbi:MAG: hypothetical protein NT076_02450 [Candidatus Pacearchaeota archaeon]|nr:hypothetical protein [Candidatus Pacearchaeota archaeon]